MICPYCKSKETKVVDKRDTEESPVTRRRRECNSCEKRFTTYERMENIELEVEKRSGKKEPFDRDKLRRGLARSVRKNITEEQIDQLVEDIELDLCSSGKKSVKTSEIGDLVMKNLLKLDKLSYLRFASVYKDFRGLDDFANEINSIRSL